MDEFADEQQEPQPELPPEPQPEPQPHPQLAELEGKISWFLEHTQYELCVVVEPESQSIVRFHIPLRSKRGFRDAKLGRVMEVELTPDEAVREELLEKIGFERVGERKANFDGQRNQVFPRFEKLTREPKQAARDVVRVMEEVFLVGEGAWLWTFHLDDPDQWPDPLPKPHPWPPRTR